MKIHNFEELNNHAQEVVYNSRSTVHELGVTTNFSLVWCGQKLPKGVVYGADKYGQFFCRDYRVKGRGFDKKTGWPCLVIWRPGDNRLIHRVEASPTTRDVFELYMKLTDEAEEKGLPDPCQIQYRSLNKQAREIARQIDLRPAYDEVHYTGRPCNWEPKPRTSFVVIERHKTLEQIADEQRGRLYL